MSNNLSVVNLSPEEEIATINYYAARKWYRHIIILCDALLKRRIQDPVLMFWRCFGVIHDGKPTEAIRELQILQEKRDLLVAGPLALIAAHERCSTVDQDAIEELHAKVTISTSSPKTLTERALLTATLFQWHIGQIDSAKSYLRLIMEHNIGGTSTGGSLMASCYNAWIDSGNVKDAVKTTNMVDSVLSHNPKELEALLLRLKLLRRNRKQTQQALEVTTQMIAFFPSFYPAYTERMYIMLELGTWDQALDCAQRAMSLNPDSIDALAVTVISDLCRGSSGSLGGIDEKRTSQLISSLFSCIQKCEPNDQQIALAVLRPIIRLSGRKAPILEQCSKILETLYKSMPSNANKGAVKCEIALVRYMQGQLQQARDNYQEAASMETNSITAFEGLIRCLILLHDFDHAEEQLELFIALSTGSHHNHHHHNSNGTATTVANHNISAIVNKISYLESLLSWHKNRDAEKRLKHLKECAKSQIDNMSMHPMSLEYYVLVNPDYLLDIIRDFSDHCPSDPKKDGEEVHLVVRVMQPMVEATAKMLPGSVEASFHLAKILYLSSDLSNAQNNCSACLKIDPSFSKAHILMAQINVASNQPKLAIQSLEASMSYNFQVRNMPMFHIIKAKALKMQGLYDEALSTLNTAMSLPGIKTEIKSKNENSKGFKSFNDDTIPTTGDRATLFLECVDTNLKLKRINEATKLMDEAMRLFSGTSEGGRLVLTNADLALDRGEIDAALQILTSVTPDKAYYIEAKTRMADIYKNHKNDLRAYCRCFSEIVERNPSVTAWILLGDAYMSIQEPEKGIAIYERALETNPKAVILAGKIGKALVKTHDFKRALKYYEHAVTSKSAGMNSLRYDLADLYRKLRRYDEGEASILDALESIKAEDITVRTPQEVNLTLLLARIYRAAGAHEKSVSAFMRSKELQAPLIGRDSATADEASKLCAQICFELAEEYEDNLKDKPKALMFYNEALSFDAYHKKASLAVAKLYVEKGDLTSAQAQCQSVIKTDINSEEATMMMGEIMFRNNDYDAALFQFNQLLKKNPNNFKALLQLIDMLRRSGKLMEAESLFATVEKNNFKIGLRPGYHYCKGLFHRYTNNPNMALREFNHCRRDPEWKEKAVYQMIEIFLNPENETLGGDAMDATDKIDAEKSDTELLGVLTADKLLQELPSNPPVLRTQILECYAIMSSKKKPDVERALAKLMEILNHEREHIPALLAMATAYMLQKQAPKARNQLKRISKMEYEPELAEEFERAWLLLSDIYINGGKYDLATELLKKCLQYNKSCSRAWEYMGFIMEKESSYKDAAEHYESAWKLDKQSNPAMGFKLAFNYLKAKRYVDAIDIAHKVLDEFPEYPKIRKDILEKARMSIRA